MERVRTLLALYGYPPPLLLSSMEATLVVTLMMAAREQLRQSTSADVDAAFFSNGRKA